MKKLFLFALFLLVILMPALVEADGLVTCDGADCTIEKFFTMLGKIYSFIVKDIATPLAVIALIIGGIFILISAGNPGLAGKGKQILWAAVIGLVLAWGSHLIINSVLNILGYNKGL